MSSNNDITYLGKDFNPSELDVIVGRGKVCYKHSGNLRLGRIVQSVLATYSAAEATKKSKTELIKSIVNQIREASPAGGFVKFDSERGEWFEVGDRTAREKVSQAFRDSLTDQYKSSSTSKTLKRRQERITRQCSGDSETATTVEPLNPGGTLYADPVASLSSFGNMSLTSPSPRASFTSNKSPRRSMTLPNRSPHSSLSFGSPSPRNSLNLGAPSPRSSSMALRSPGATLGLTAFGASPSPFAASPSPMPVGNLVSPLSAGFSTSPAQRQLSARFSASPSPLAMSLAAQNAGLGVMNESPSSIRLAVAIAERKRRLTNLNMMMAGRGGANARQLGGAFGNGRPQVPHTL